MSVIDIHTHMFGHGWLKMLKEHGQPNYSADKREDNRDYLIEKGAPACAFEPEAFDYDLRVKAMDKFGIDISVVSLTSPSVFWGGPEISLETAIIANDEMAAGRQAHPDRIRWFASLPWQYPELAVEELQRCHKNGASGVMCLANVQGQHLIDPAFVPIWTEIDRLQLPVLVHPTAPFGAKKAEFQIERILMPSTGFMFDTTLAIARMVVDGFFDRFPNIRIIVSHGGGYLPYVSGRLDLFFEVETLVKMKITDPPSTYLNRLYYDSIVYDPGALDLCLEIAGPGHVLFGTDFPMPADIPKLYSLIDRLPGDQVAAIKGKNAETLFSL